MWAAWVKRGSRHLVDNQTVHRATFRKWDGEYYKLGTLFSGHYAQTLQLTTPKLRHDGLGLPNSPPQGATAYSSFHLN